MAIRKLSVGFAVTASLTLFIGLLAASLGQAGSVRTDAAVKISPHAVTEGEGGFITAIFTNSGPSTVNHAVATVGKAVFDTSGEITAVAPMPIPAGMFSVPSDCTVTGTSTALITCDFGQVKSAVLRRVLEFTLPPEATFDPFHVGISVSYDERKGSALTDTVREWDRFPFSVADSGDASLEGTCEDTITALTLTASTSTQRTEITYPPLSEALFPCTPATVGVDTESAPSGVAEPFGEISFVDFLGDGGLATVKVYFATTPAGVNQNNLELFELARFPIDLTATNGGAPVPACVLDEDTEEWVISDDALEDGYISCVFDVSNIPGGGLVASLRALGGDDGGWGGIS